MRTIGSGQSAILLLDVVEVLNNLNVPYAVVGAFAASFYGVIRASVDVDAVISLEAGRIDIETLIAALEKIGLQSRFRKGDLKDPVGAVLNVGDAFENRVDLIMNIRGMKDACFARAVQVEFMQTKIQLVGVEDFIAMKLFAGGRKDLSDVAGVLEVSTELIDQQLLRELAVHYGEDCLQQLERLIKKLDEKAL